MLDLNGNRKVLYPSSIETVKNIKFNKNNISTVDLVIVYTFLDTLKAMVSLQHELVFEEMKPHPHTPGEDILELNGNRKALYQPKQIKFNEDYTADLVLIYTFLDALKAFLSQKHFVQDMIRNNNSLFS